jgi:hypothetical protein
MNNNQVNKSLVNKYLFVGGPVSGMVLLLPSGSKKINIKDGERIIQVYKKVSIAYGNKHLRLMTYDVFTPNGEQSNELKAEFERQLPHLLEKL